MNITRSSSSNTVVLYKTVREVLSRSGSTRTTYDYTKELESFRMNSNFTREAEGGWPSPQSTFNETMKEATESKDVSSKAKSSVALDKTRPLVFPAEVNTSNEVVHYDRPNPDLSGYVRVPVSLKQVLNIHCSSCAIVSSSGQMLGTNAGKHIDRNPCVIRMNDAPVKSFEADVGNKTTVRIVGHASSSNLKREQINLFQGTGTPQHVIMWGPRDAMKWDGRGWGYNNINNFSRAYRRIKFYMMTQTQMGYADRSFEEETGKNRAHSGTWLSTGWFTMQLARNICDRIHVYGMVNDEYCTISENQKKNISYHYYANKKKNRTECGYYNHMEYSSSYGNHRLNTEKNIYARWALLNPKITFHYPSWEPAKNSSFEMWWHNGGYNPRGARAQQQGNKLQRAHVATRRQKNT